MNSGVSMIAPHSRDSGSVQAEFGLRETVLHTLALDTGPLDGVTLDFDPNLSLLWVTFSAQRHCITSSLLNSARRLVKSIKSNFGGDRPLEGQILKYVAYRSDDPKVFLYGADFDIFLRAIRSGDPQVLFDYAYSCVDFCFENYNLIGGSIPTIAVVSGSTFGGGFEAVAACNVVIADRTAEFQLPEMRFSSFPGLAYSIVGRRAPMAALHEMVMNSSAWSAEKARQLGVVDVLTEDNPIKATEAYVARMARKHAGHCGALKAMNRVKGLSRAELHDIIEEWVICTMAVPRSAANVIAKLREAQSLVNGTIATTATH
jgi:enoyl-CoA hydratase/carnithine racemase